MTRLTPIVLLAILLLGAPGAAQACPVCMAGLPEEVRYAFLWTAGFLSVLPLGLVGVLVWYVRRRARALAEAEAHPEVALAPAREIGLSRASSSR